MAKKSKSTSLGETFVRVLGGIWRAIAKAVGATVRFITRGAKDLDPEHKRDGIGLLLLIATLLSIATTWWQLDNFFGHAVRALLFGVFGKLAIATPLLFGYLAIRIFRAPQEKESNGRVSIGLLLFVASISGLLHLIITAAPASGFTKYEESAGWIGYLIATPLVYLGTDLLALPILTLIFFFSILVITATPVSSVVGVLRSGFSKTGSRVKGAIADRRARIDEDFEVNETPPFETPLVQEFSNTEDEEEIDEGEFDEEFTVEVPKTEAAPAKSTRPVQLVLTPNDSYELPSLDLLRTTPPSKGKSKAN